MKKELYMFLGSLCYAAMSLFIKGFVLMKLWSWIVVSNFNVGKLNYSASIGIMLAILFVFAVKDEKKTDDADYFKILVNRVWFLFWFSGLVLLIGWLVSFMY